MGKRLSERRGSITAKQAQYLSALYREAVSKLWTLHCGTALVGCDMHHIDMLSMASASHYIDTLKAAKDSGWKVPA